MADDKYSFLVKNLAHTKGKSLLYKTVLNGIDNDVVFASKYFGTPMWDNLILDTEDKKLIIDMVLITVSMTKNIVKTPITGMSGTIKEYISDGDFAINIKGALFGDKNSNEYPEDEVLTFLEICKKNESIRIESGFLGRLNIDDIVIENYKLETKEGTNNVQFFEINAVSDMAEELIFRT